MKKEGSPLRKAINQHLHRKHRGFAGVGSTENRIIQHEMLHAKGGCDHTHDVHDDDPSNFTAVMDESSMREEGNHRDRSDFIG